MGSKMGYLRGIIRVPGDPKSMGSGTGHPGMAQRARSADTGVPGYPARPQMPLGTHVRPSCGSTSWFVVPQNGPIGDILDLGMFGLVQSGPEWSRMPGIHCNPPCRGVLRGPKRVLNGSYSGRV